MVDKASRWSKSSKAAKFLKHALMSGEIDPNEPPRNIHASNPLFQEYSLATFRNNLTKLKTELGIHVRKPCDTKPPPLATLAFNDEAEECDGKFRWYQHSG